MKNTIYGMTKNEALMLSNHFENNVQNFALILWNKGKVKTIQSGLKRAKKIIQFSKN